MTLLPPGVKVHLAFGFIDMRKGLASPGLLAHVLVAKYCDHLPLCRPSQIFGRQGVELDRSTLANGVAGACWWLEPLQARLA